MKLWFVLGTAAELIKMYPVIREARARGIDWKIVSTGQSPVGLVRQISDFEISPAAVLTPVKSVRDLHSSWAALRWFARARSCAPSWYDEGPILVHGDTLSTLVGAHWGRVAGAPVVHVEAGLRSPSLFSPFPEEINRRLVSRKATWHMAPGSGPAANLRAAGVTKNVVDTGGNTLADVLKIFAAEPNGAGRGGIVNIHRYENLRSGKKWKCIEETIEKAAALAPLTWVMHPQTKAKMDPRWRERMGGRGLTFTERLPFTIFIKLLSEAAFLISDGGSNQEECSYLGVPCLLMRNETERTEGLGENNLLSQFDPARIDGFLADPQAYRRAPRWPPFSPSAKIIEVLRDAGFGQNRSPDL